MKNIVVSLLGAVSLLMATGCASNVKQIGQVGNVQFYRVRANSFSGPNIASLVTKDSEGNVAIQQTYGGPGLGAAVISAAGNVGSSAVLGLSFPKNVGDNVSASGGVVTATGGNSASSASSHATTSSSSTSTSSSNATGGYGGAGGAGGAGGHGGHPASPGNGGVPGNGGQNPNKP